MKPPMISALGGWQKIINLKRLELFSSACDVLRMRNLWRKTFMTGKLQLDSFSIEVVATATILNWIMLHSWAADELPLTKEKRITKFHSSLSQQSLVDVNVSQTLVLSIRVERYTRTKAVQIECSLEVELSFQDGLCWDVKLEMSQICYKISSFSVLQQKICLNAFYSVSLSWDC